jgi:hypothetical protein
MVDSTNQPIADFFSKFSRVMMPTKRQTEKKSLTIKEAVPILLEAEVNARGSGKGRVPVGGRE